MMCLYFCDTLAWSPLGKYPVVVYVSDTELNLRLCVSTKVLDD